MANLRGGGGLAVAPSHGPNFFNFMVFFRKCIKYQGVNNFTRWLVLWNAKMSLKNLEGIDIPHIFHFDMQFRWPRHVHKTIVWKHCQFMVHNNLAWNLPKPEMKRGSINFPPQTLKSLHGTYSCNWQSQNYKKHARWCFRPKWLNCPKRWDGR